MKRCSVARFGLVVLAAMLGAGCLFSPEPKTEPVPPIVDDFCYSPDELIAAFKTAYTGRDADAYRHVLSPEYAFLLRPEDVIMGENDRLTFTQELAVAENMFSGLPIERTGYSPVPGISSISISVLNRQGTWLYMGADDPDFPNTQRGLYDIQLSFARAGANTIIVNGQQAFYVAGRDTVIRGETRVYYQLRGQRDLTIGSKTEMDSWGSVKNLYR